MKKRNLKVIPVAVGLGLSVAVVVILLLQKEPNIEALLSLLALGTAAQGIALLDMVTANKEDDNAE